MKQLVIYCTLLLLLWSCRNKDRQAEPVAIEDEEELMAWEENDTLRLSSIPMGLDSWLGYYHSLDTGFRLANFKASGVVLHFNELDDPETRGDEDTMKEYFIFSLDSSRYLDLFSYDHFINNGELVEGEADQQVTIADPGRGKKKQLLFVGPSQSADFADWLTNDVFMLGITSRSEDGKRLDAQLLVFSLPDSTFTNFNLDHSLPIDRLMAGPRGFTGPYLDKLRKK